MRIEISLSRNSNREDTTERFQDYINTLESGGYGICGGDTLYDCYQRPYRVRELLIVNLSWHEVRVVVEPI